MRFPLAILAALGAPASSCHFGEGQVPVLGDVQLPESLKITWYYMLLPVTSFYYTILYYTILYYTMLYYANTILILY